jgi:transcription elongation GreA/GreB family factor/very-short-patch-repair endonuclease
LSDIESGAAERLRELLGYVEQVVKLDEKAAFKLADYRLATGQIYQFYQHQFHALPGIKHDQSDDDGAIWLTIERLKRRSPPKPREDLSAWLENGNDPEKQPQVCDFILKTLSKAEKESLIAEKKARAEDCHPAIAKEDEGKFDVRLRLEDRPEITSETSAYIEGPWLSWANEELPRRRSIALYQRLFEAVQQVELGGPDQAIEVVWGIGLTRWVKDGTLIDLPLIERLVEVEIDEQAGGLIRVRPRQAEAVINLRPYEELRLENVALVLDSARRALARSAEADGVSPFAPETYEPILKSCQAQLDADGRYLPETDNYDAASEMPAASSQLTVSDCWVLFARRRSDNFILRDIENLKKSVEENKDDLPGPAKTLVMGPNDDGSNLWKPLGGNIGETPGDFEPDKDESPLGDLFFPKPYNDEQVEIVRRLENEDGVVVQGPPGTGKTHTISNIICHYLAKGRRVLVVSHGEAALSVLREKLPEEIRKLAISITTSEREGLKQLEGAIRVLQSIVQTLKPGEQQRLIRDVEASIIHLRERIAAIDVKIAEVATVQLSNVPGREITPADLAKAVVASRETCQWFDDRPKLFLSESGITPFDIENARRHRIQLGKRIEYFGGEFPSTFDLPTPQVMARLHEDIARAQEHSERAALVTSFTPRLTNLEAVATAESAADALETLIATAKHFEQYPWLASFAESGFHQAPAALPALLAFLDNSSELLNEYRQFVQTPVSLPETTLATSEFDAVLKKLSEGQNVFGLFAFSERKLKPVIDEIRIVGRKPHSATEWAHVRSFHLWRGQHAELGARWNAIAIDIGISPDQTSNLNTLAGLTGALRAVLQIAPGKRQELAGHLPKVLVKTPSTLWPSISQMESLRDCLRDAAAATRLSASRAEILRIAALFTESSKKLGSIVSTFFEQAVGKKEVAVEKVESIWASLLATLDDIASQRPAFAELEAAADKIELSGAAKWAERLRHQSAIDGYDPVVPSNWAEAWDWAASTNFLMANDQRATVRALAVERAELDITREKALERLVRERTFYSLAGSLSGQIRANLLALAAALRKIGGGTGVGAARNRRAAQQAMAGCFGGVPCWIMPSWRVAEQLPGDVGTFDLVIMDEASQSDIKEVTALLRGKKILVVGDDKQVSPTAAFIPNAQIARLERTYLSKQQFKTLLLPGSSLYDLAKVMFPNSFVMLREHFRCVEPIIQFSTQFYTEPLVPLRVPTPQERLDPPLIDIYVPDGVRSGDKINHREAEVVVDEIERFINTPALAVKLGSDEARSIGVISLIGSKQAALIGRMVQARIGEEKVMRHRIACGDSATFQGNERDVVFLSMVADPQKKQAQTAMHFEQRFNVAMSRARDRLYVVRSVREEELNPKDLKASIIRHMREPMKGRAPSSGDLEALCDSDFERAILRPLVAQGYRVQPQVGAMGYSIDMVVEGDGNARLAIECDGDKYHGPEKWADDMKRQRVLERVGWKFWRCWSSSFTVDPDGCMADLYGTLDRLAIRPSNGIAAQTIYTEHREAERAERVAIAPSVNNRAASTGAIIGDRVIVRYMDESRNASFEITADRDDVVNGHVSASSPLGRQLLGAQEEDELEYDVNGTLKRVLVMRIERDRRDAEAA